MKHEPKTAYPFEQALTWLKGGRKITRRGWNGQGMYIYLVPEQSIAVGSTDDTAVLMGIKAEGVRITMAARIDMQYANGDFGVWSPTPEDLLAHDWNLLM